MGKRQAIFPNYQQRATEFKLGDSVFPFVGGDPYQSGRVVAVYPGIGMVDVEFPHGNVRYPVEDLQRYESKDVIEPAREHDTVPGGAGTVEVSGGPRVATVQPRDVAEEWVKQALYWKADNRRYRATKAELDADEFHCPKCKDQVLRGAIYKRRDQKSERLFGCPSCLFLIKQCDIHGHPSYCEPESDEGETLKIDQGFDSVRNVQANNQRQRLTWGVN